MDTIRARLIALVQAIDLNPSIGEGPIRACRRLATAVEALVGLSASPPSKASERGARGSARGRSYRVWRLRSEPKGGTIPVDALGYDLDAPSPSIAAERFAREYDREPPPFDWVLVFDRVGGTTSVFRIDRAFLARPFSVEPVTVDEKGCHVCARFSTSSGCTAYGYNSCFTDSREPWADFRPMTGLALPRPACRNCGGSGLIFRDCDSAEMDAQEPCPACSPSELSPAEITRSEALAYTADADFPGTMTPGRTRWGVS